MGYRIKPQKYLKIFWNSKDDDNEELDDLIFFETSDYKNTKNEISVKNKLSRSERALQYAIDLAESKGWNEHDATILWSIFNAFNYTSTRYRIEELIDLGAQPNELALAAEIRIAWRSDVRYHANLRGKPEFLHSTPSISWKYAHLISKSYEDIDHVISFLDTAYERWWNEEKLQGLNLSFAEYVYGIYDDDTWTGDSIEFEDEDAGKFTYPK